MLTDVNYIAPELAEKIKDTAVMEDVIASQIELKPSGTNKVGNCPCCGGKKKLNVNKAKQIWKCFVCEVSGTTAVSFLMKTQSMSYPEALKWLAAHYNIDITPKVTEKKKNRGSRKRSFRDTQLRASGIPTKYQRFLLGEESGKQIEIDRYQKGTIDKMWNVVAGDDMILNYVGLDGRIMKYRTVKGREKPLIRLRWANPSLHQDKNGNFMKYKSPYKSGSNLWIPNWMIAAYRGGQIIETLYITEGEKKADKMCLEGMPTVGIMGINNFASMGDMPYQFQLIIKRCAVAKVVFVLDSDWQDLSIKNGKSVESRPMTFFKAVVKFQRYFAAYANDGIELGIFFAYGKDAVHKGIDDMLVHDLKGKEDKLREDFETAMKSRTGEGEYVNVHNITVESEYKIREFWHLQNAAAFMNHYAEQLKKLNIFTLFKLKRKWNSETEEFELIQKILPSERFWTVDTWKDREGKERKKYGFSYRNIRQFLNRRGYGLFETLQEKYRFVHVEQNIVREVHHNEIQRYVVDFMEQEQEVEVVEMLLRGGKQYLGPDRLANMFFKQPEFLQADKNCQYMIFKNEYWKITADKIEARPLSELPRAIWNNKIIDFAPEYLGQPMVDVQIVGEHFVARPQKVMDECEIAQFNLRTSDFAWQKRQELKKDEHGYFYAPREIPEAEDKADRRLRTANFVCKMIATGYVMHEYKDYSKMKAIVAMDGIESEVGRSNGGTGKSIWGTQFEHAMPIEVIDGKKKNITEDEFIYSNVDERTGAIVFDDCRVNMDIEHFFSQMTRGIEVNVKRENRYKLPPPRFIFLTNHAFRGEGNSFKRRQYYLSFSDYYNGNRTVADDFGHQLFHEWDYKQWNYFYNWMATCIQVYLKHGLKHQIPSEALERRRLRQEIGEDFLEWATEMFYQEPDEDGRTGILLNNRFEKNVTCDQLIKRLGNRGRYMTPKIFKHKLQQYCKYAKLDFNPTAQEGKRLMSSGKEYFILANQLFDVSTMRTIKDERDFTHQPY